MTEDQKESLRELVNSIAALAKNLDAGTKVTGTHRVHGYEFTIIIEKAKP